MSSEECNSTLNVGREGQSAINTGRAFISSGGNYEC